MMKSKLHWTTEISEKGLLAVIGGLTMIAAGLDIYQMVWIDMKIELADLFLLFIIRFSNSELKFLRLFLVKKYTK